MTPDVKFLLFIQACALFIGWLILLVKVLDLKEQMKWRDNVTERNLKDLRRDVSDDICTLSGDVKSLSTSLKQRDEMLRALAGIKVDVK